MYPNPILTFLSIALAASAPAPAPASTSSSCNAPQVVACCNSFSKNSTGLGCIFSTLNFLNPVCPSSQSLACCNDSPQTGLVNVQCVPISIAL